LPQKAVTLEDFSWLAGRWEGHLGPMTAEQQWMTPRNAILTRVDGDTYISHGDITDADGGQSHRSHLPPREVIFASSKLRSRSCRRSAASSNSESYGSGVQRLRKTEDFLQIRSGILDAVRAEQLLIGQRIVLHHHIAVDTQ
jgi:hypothetical protein